MAIDFMTMPLSRYLSGDFITPQMRFAWEQGVAYSIIGPEGAHQVLRDLPFGGPDAASNRARFVPMLLDDLRTLPPPVSSTLWDEESSAAPTFHRVEVSSYNRLLAEAHGRTERRGFLGLRKRAVAVTHLTATVFFPVDFEVPFDLSVIFERLAGSAPVALRELELGEWSVAAASARATLTDALRDAVSLRLPMIVDS